MISVKDKIAGQGEGEQSALLHGSDVQDKKTVTIHVLRVRVAPKSFNAVLIVDIDPIAKCKAWAINKTNTRILRDVVFPGQDDPNFEDLEGMDIVLQVVPENNPKTDTLVPSLQVSPTENGPKTKRGKK